MTHTERSKMKFTDVMVPITLETESITLLFEVGYLLDIIVTFASTVQMLKCSKTQCMTKQMKLQSRDSLYTSKQALQHHTCTNND
ncbi:hypothetical protein AALO_G00256180, partial [Alosa alosa]